MKNFVALIDKWNPGIYGNGRNEAPYLNYFSTKYYLIWSLSEPSDLWNEYKDFPRNLQMAYIWNNQLPVTLHFTVCKASYLFKSRLWVVKNISFYNFIKKMKRYYKSKLAFYKNPINLRFKEIHGKYPHFSLPKR